MRIIDGDGRLLGSGTAEVDFWDAPRAQTAGTVPITFMLFDKPKGAELNDNDFKKGFGGAGVVSAKQLAGARYKLPKALARYDAGLIVRDANGDGKLDAAKDQIIGGVKSGPSGADAYEVRSLVQGGGPLLSQLVATLSPKRGKRFGGAIMQVQFQAGAQKGRHRPTFALLNDAANPASGDGTFYTYTVIVE